jgi:adenylate kinase family enzyme
MTVKLFILGLPGSGKSGAARLIKAQADKHGWFSHHFKDYPILYRMFKADKEGKRFKSTLDRGYDGFDGLDPTAYDEALEILNRQVLQHKRPADESKELLIIEFARDDYCKALNFFVSHMSQDTYFLFIDADIPTCIQRIQARVAKPPVERTEDDRYVSEYIFETYYQKDHRDYLNSDAVQMQNQFSLYKESIHVIDNGPTVSEQQFKEWVERFARGILKQL